MTPPDSECIESFSVGKDQMRCIEFYTVMFLTIGAIALSGCSEKTQDQSASTAKASDVASVAANDPSGPVIRADEVQDTLFAHIRGEDGALSKLVIGDRESAIEMMTWLRLFNSVLEEDEISAAAAGASAEARTKLATQMARRDEALAHINAQWAGYFKIGQSEFVGQWFLDRPAMEAHIAQINKEKYPDSPEAATRATQSLVRSLESDRSNFSLNVDGTFRSSGIFNESSGWVGDGYWEPTESGVALYPLTRRPGIASFNNDRSYQLASETSHLVWAGKLFLRAK